MDASRQQIGVFPPENYFRLGGSGRTDSPLNSEICNPGV
jgi:hypothetical protein